MRQPEPLDPKALIENLAGRRGFQGLSEGMVAEQLGQVV